jgi:hypothetical protein
MAERRQFVVFTNGIKDEIAHENDRKGITLGNNEEYKEND